MVQSILAGGEGQCSDSSRVPVPVVLSLALSDLLLEDSYTLLLGRVAHAYVYAHGRTSLLP